MLLFGRLLERLEGETTLVAGGEKARLLQGLGVVRQGKAFESLSMHEVFADEPARRLGAALGRFDMLVSCFAAGDDSAQNRLAEALLVPTSPARGQGGGSPPAAAFLPIRPPDDFPRHLIDLWLEVLGQPSPSALEYPAWPAPQAWRDAAGRLVGPCDGRPLAVIHPGSGGLAKCWPLEGFVGLARWLADRGGMAVRVVVGPAELERWPPCVLAELRPLGLIEQPPLDVLAGLLSLASIYIGNDSGVSHLAAALGTPTVAIFGPSSPTHFAPLGPRVAVVTSASAAWPDEEAIRKAVVAARPVP